MAAYRLAPLRRPCPFLVPPPALAQSKPDTPSSVSVSRGDGTLNASWQAPARAETYHITYSSDGGNSWSLAALNHPSNSITISGVDNSESYIVGVRARNSAGDSGWRNSSSVGRYEPPPAPPKPPASPTGLSATGSDESVTLRWNRATSDVTGYQFQFREAPPAPGWSDWYTVPDGGKDTTYYTIHKLENGTEYRFKLRAVNSGAVSPPAPTSAPWYVSATPDPNVQPPKPPSAPPAPSSVTASRGTGTIVASWHHSKGATGYDVRYSTDDGSTWKFAALHWNTSVITIKGASGDKSYIVGVRAVNLVGESDWTNSDTVGPVPQPVSVSNMGESSNSYATIGTGTGLPRANAFTTGSKLGGYTLASVSGMFQAPNGSPGDMTLAIHESSDGSPASSAQVTLAGSNPTTAGTYTWTCSGDCYLLPSTTYFVVAMADAPGTDYYSWSATTSNNETNTPSGSGWELADGLRTYLSGVWLNISSDSLVFKVDAN